MERSLCYYEVGELAVGMAWGGGSGKIFVVRGLNGTFVNWSSCEETSDWRVLWV
jgi:hypothetical protein